jgi:peptidoglycan hydrolase-like protein with peptidoglycan-binding domain
VCVHFDSVKVDRHASEDERLSGYAAHARICGRAYESYSGLNVHWICMKRAWLYLVITMCTASLLHADPAIRSLQQTLKQQGLYYGAVTGDKSAETTAAIRRYQIRNGLKVTGEINEETLQSLKSSSNSLASTSRPNSKPATQIATVAGDPSPGFTAKSPSSSLSQPDRPLATNPSYSASFYQPAPRWVNRRMIAAAQYQLMTRGYYHGRVDGTCGPQTAFALCVFQSSAGLPATGRLDSETLEALGLSDTEVANLAPAARQYETWIPMTKFKNGEWKMKWKKYRQSWGEHTVEDRQENLGYPWQADEY